MKKVITYGTYDLLHQGHINLLRRAKQLGDYLIVGVTTDSFDLERGKLNVCNNVMERIKAVEATGLADQIVIEEYVGQKIDDIKRYGVDVFAIGSDWEGKFDYLKEFCEVVYLPRTEGISSTLLRDTEMNIRIGIVGTGSIADRFAKEARYVSRAGLTAVYNPDIRQAERFAQENAIAAVAPTFEELSASVDAIYVASPHLTHYDYTRRALLAGKHVLCEPPFVLSKKEAVELYTLAEERGLILMVALKTAYFPAFNHLITLLKSGTIGEIVEINSSVTTLVDESSSKLNPDAAGGSMNENACFPLLPIFKLLGTAYKDIRFISRFRNGTDIYTKCVMAYENGVGSFQVGLGVKSEGSLIVSGTKGYAYVPAPWWKPDYFELRYENPESNRKFFYPYQGSGLRYEIKAFLSGIIGTTNSFSSLSYHENIIMAEIQETFLAQKPDTILTI